MRLLHGVGGDDVDSWLGVAGVQEFVLEEQEREGSAANNTRRRGERKKEREGVITFSRLFLFSFSVSSLRVSSMI